MLKNFLKCTLTIFFILLVGVLHAAEFTAVYTVITDFGTTSEMTAALQPGERLVKSSAPLQSYRTRSIAVRSEEHLLELMGASNEAELTDIQKGLLETYRISKNPGFAELGAYLPTNTAGITLNLVDIAGYEDVQRFPAARKDFWPKCRKLNGNRGRTCEIIISGIDVVGYGPYAAARMKAVYAHEFGHTLDLTRIETGAYGHDGTHFVNEKIQPRAAFAEGVANFVRWLFDDSTEKEFRDSLQTIKIEKSTGGYDEYPAETINLAGEDYLGIEALNTLVLASLANALPNGVELLLTSFKKHNSSKNSMKTFLRNFLVDYPEHSASVATILDRETSGKLKSEDFYAILGNSRAVKKYVQDRTTAQSSSVAAERAPDSSGTRQIVIENNGNPFAVDP